MALLGFEGFDSINSPTDLILGPFSSVLGGTNPTINTSNARGGSGNCIGLNGTASPGMQLLRGIGSAVQTIIIGAALLPTNGKVYLGVFNGTVCQASFACDTSGNLTVYRGNPTSGILLGTAPTIVLASVYNYFELQVTVSTSNGSITARVNGTIVLNLSSVNTSVDGSSIINQIGVGSSYLGAGNSAYVDDMYVADLTGNVPYNSFLGDVHVTTLFPTGNGVVTWTPQSGANWQAVSETAMDSDSSYNSSNIPGQIDTFTTPGITITPSTIYGVQVKMASRMEAGGADQIGAVVSSGSAQQVGSAQTVLSSYTYIDQVFVVDPNTSAAWTKAGVNAAQFGYKRIS